MCIKIAAVSPSYLEELVNLGEVDPLLGVQFVDVAAVSVHQVEAEPHHLRVGEARQHSIHLLRANREPNATVRCTRLEQHVLLAGGEVHLVLVVVHAQVDDVGQQLLVAVDHLELLLQRLWWRGGRDD